MNNVYSVIDWLFNTFVSIWGIVVQSWCLSVPILLCIFLQIFMLIKGIYTK